MLKYRDMTEGHKHIDLGNVHNVLAHSYVSYFVLLVFGLLIHLFFPIDIYNHPLVGYLGFALLFLATLLILWAQTTSRKLDIKNINTELFFHGPYCYTRMPTHWGLFFLMFGFGLMINSLFVVLFTFIFFIITKLSFIKREEAILVAKYGQAYEKYKASVRI